MYKYMLLGHHAQQEWLSWMETWAKTLHDLTHWFWDSWQRTHDFQASEVNLWQRTYGLQALEVNLWIETSFKTMVSQVW